MPPLANPVKLPNWEVLGGESIIPADLTVNLTIPNNTTEIFQMVAEGGVAYYHFGANAKVSSPGFIPENGRVIEGPIRDLLELAPSVFAAAGVTLHIIYYRRNTGK